MSDEDGSEHAAQQQKGKRLQVFHAFHRFPPAKEFGVKARDIGAEVDRILAESRKFHRYSLRNVMLIAMQKPTATHAAGFHAWRKFGRFVKKGEKGILIIAPVVRRKEAHPAIALKLLNK